MSGAMKGLSMGLFKDLYWIKFFSDIFTRAHCEEKGSHEQFT